MSHWANNVWWWQLDASTNASHFIEPKWFLLDWDINEQREDTIWGAIEALNLKPKICFCWETMNWYWDGAYCPNWCIFSDKPSHILWWNYWNHSWDELSKATWSTQDMVVESKKPFQETILQAKHYSPLNKTNNDGKVVLYGFEKQWSKLILSLSVQFRWESKPYTHVGRRKWPTWKRDGELVYTKKTSKWRKIKKNIRIHLAPWETWYNVSDIFSWKKKDSYQYIKMWDWWYLWEEQDLTFDKISIQNIAKEAYGIYKAYMAQ